MEALERWQEINDWRASDIFLSNIYTGSTFSVTDNILFLCDFMLHSLQMGIATDTILLDVTETVLMQTLAESHTLRWKFWVRLVLMLLFFMTIFMCDTVFLISNNFNSQDLLVKFMAFHSDYPKLNLDWFPLR